jgi:hypothetical protein
MRKSLSLSFTQVIALFFSLLLAACGNGGSGANGAPSTFEVDATLQPAIDEIQFIDGAGSRPVGCIVDEDGNHADFVEDEVIVAVEVSEDIPEIAARLHGTVLFEVDPNATGLLAERSPIFALLRVDAPETSPEELAALAVGHGDGAGHLRLCSQRSLNTLAAIARESFDEGTTLAANFLLTPDEISDRVASESPSSTSAAPRFGAGYSPNAFDLPYMNRGSEQDIGAAEAARMVHQVVGEATGRNRVDLMIIDGGFLPLDDYPDAEIIPAGSFSRANPLGSCSGGRDCPWHGTTVASAALGRFNDGIGAAGPAGPAVLDGDSGDETSFVNPIFVQSPRLNFWDILEFVLVRVPEAFGRFPDIANISASGDLPAGACFLGACDLLNELGRQIDRAGILLFASAGNDAADVDAERCGAARVICFERAYRVPCEMPGVVCVGGLANDRDIRAGSSAWGSKQHTDDGSVDIYAPFGMWVHDTPTRGGGVTPPSTQADWVQGTSYSSPFAAGVAALIKAANPRLGRDEIWEVMRDTAHTKGPFGSVNRWVNAFGAAKRALGGGVPFANIESPTGGRRFSLGQSIPLGCDVNDDDGMDDVTITWSSDVDGAIGAESSSTAVTRLREGVHQITCTATDGRFTVSDTVEISVGNDAPTVEITAPISGARLDAGATIWVRARVGDANGNLDEVYWQLFNSLGLPTGWSATGPEPTIPRDHLAAGRYTLVATAYDTEGERAQDQVTLTIQAAPSNAGPSVDAMVVEPLTTHEYDDSNGLFTESCPVDISGDGRVDHQDLCRRVRITAYVSDDHDPVSLLTYRWIITNDAGVVAVFNTTVPTLVYDFPLGSFEVRLVATDSAGVASDPDNTPTKTVHVVTLF